MAFVIFLGLFASRFVEDQNETDIRIQISESENKESCGILSKSNSIEKPKSVEDSTNSKERSEFYCFRDEEENMTNTFPASTHQTSHENEKMKMRKKEEEEEEQKGKTNKIIRYIAWVTRKLIRPIFMLKCELKTNKSRLGRIWP